MHNARKEIIKWGIGIASVAYVTMASAANLKTIADQSGFKRTGRYDEVVRLCAEYQKAWPKQVRCFEFGRTPEGRAMLALAVSADGTLDSAANKKLNRPVMLMQGGIHAGEIDGKDAGFLAMRDLLQGKVAKGALTRATLVFVPIFNIDGHERFGPNNRPNQIGPQEMGWRTTAQNLNLNRDYIKAEAPEMQAMLRLLNEWDPIVYADLHVTDGAEFEHDIAINVAPTLTPDSQLTRGAKILLDATIRGLAGTGSLPLDFYPSFLRDDDPTSGFARSVSPPRFSHEYWALRNRIGVLVETHSWKNYKTRVQGTYQAIVAMLSQTASRGTEWMAAAQAVDQQSSNMAGREVVLAYTNTGHVTNIDFRGYEYTRTASPISGATMTKYNNRRPQNWRVPLYDEVKPAIVSTAPRGGYIVPAAWASLVEPKLVLHGVEFTRINSMRDVAIQSFRATKTQTIATNEGRTTLSVEGAWQNDKRQVVAADLYVPIAQSRSTLVMMLFEPTSPDSLLSWGYFNSAFERKEYMEAYVAEQVATDMLKKDAKLKAEFDKRLQDDPAFAQSPQARLDFFYRRHPSWDERFNLYPVYRVESDTLAR